MFTVVACFAATLALILAWVSENRYERTRHELNEHLALISQIVATEQAQGKVDDALARGQRTMFRLVGGRVAPPRSLASAHR